MQHTYGDITILHVQTYKYVTMVTQIYMNLAKFT